MNLLDTHFKDYFVDPSGIRLAESFPRDTRCHDRTIILGVRAAF